MTNLPDKPALARRAYRQDTCTSENPPRIRFQQCASSRAALVIVFSKAIVVDSRTGITYVARGAPPSRLRDPPPDVVSLLATAFIFATIRRLNALCDEAEKHRDPRTGR